MANVTFTPKALPTLADLHQDPAKAFEMDQFNLLLNQPVPREWIKLHPMVKVKDERGNMVPLQYLPVDKVEFLLTRIFQEWKREILSVTAMFQSITVVVRLHVRHPLTGEWIHHDGVGASPIQTNKDASAADLGQIKSAAVQMAAPSAASYALKDAAECFGTIFGKDLNRKNTVMFQGAYGPPPVEKIEQDPNFNLNINFPPPTQEQMQQHFQAQQQQQTFNNYQTDFPL